MRIDARAVLAAGAVLMLAAACTTSTAPTSRPSVGVSSSPSPLPEATAPPCDPAELHATVLGGQGATGSIVGSLVVWNTGAQCELAGAVAFTGRTAAHAPVTGVGVNTQLVPPVHAILPAHMTAPAPGASLQGGYLVADIQAFERDDPQASGGSCAPADEVTPGEFVLTIGSVAVTATNSGASSSPATRPLEGCRGKILLEGITQSN